jgi:S1-C subfamily serine protease
MTDRALNALQEFSTAVSGIVARAVPSLVTVHSGRSRASGFVWRPHLVVTADEALADEGEFKVRTTDGASLPATLVGRDPSTDIALLRVEGGAGSPAELTTPELAPGAVAIVVGGEEDGATAAFGIVSRAGGAWRSLRGGAIDARLELDVVLRPHGEGGLAFDAAGRAFGMAVFGPRRRVLVIPTATIARVAAHLDAHGRVARGYLGLGLQQVAISGAEGFGAMVISVDPQGPGAKAGVHQGDILVAWDGEPIRHVQKLLRALGPDSVGRTVTLGLQRTGETRLVSLTVSERPAA